MQLFPRLIALPGAAELEAAFAAVMVFGNGCDHPAAPNFADLSFHALAKVRGLPLLLKGGFSETDLPPLRQQT